MADPKKTETISGSDIVTCNLYNPTKGNRVIHDGITITEGVPAGALPTQKQIHVASGETKKNVKIHRTIAEELRARNKAKKDSDLVVKPVTSDEDEDEVTTAA